MDSCDLTVSWRTEPTRSQDPEIPNVIQKNGREISTKNTAFFGWWKTVEIFFIFSPPPSWRDQTFQTQTQNPGRLENLGGGGGCMLCKFSVEIYKFGIPRIHPITIHEFLNLTYLGSIHTPRMLQRTKCMGFLGWNSKNLRINGVLLAAMGTHVSFIFRYFSCEEIWIKCYLTFFQDQETVENRPNTLQRWEFSFCDSGLKWHPPAETRHGMGGVSLST